MFEAVSMIEQVLNSCFIRESVISYKSIKYSIGGLRNFLLNYASYFSGSCSSAARSRRDFRLFLDKR